MTQVYTTPTPDFAAIEREARRLRARALAQFVTNLGSYLRTMLRAQTPVALRPGL